METLPFHGARRTLIRRFPLATRAIGHVQLEIGNVAKLAEKKFGNVAKSGAIVCRG
jgi:hypothetical protein